MHCTHTICVHECGIKRSIASNERISGDTMPCEALENLGRSAELVIHEANFEDSMIDLANQKKHSTTRRVVVLYLGLQLI